MKRLYSVIALAIMMLVSFTASAQVASVSQSALAAKRQAMSSQMHRVTSDRVLPGRALAGETVTAADLEGDYTWTYVSYLNNDEGAGTGSVTITATSATDIQIVGLLGSYPVAGTVASDGTVTIASNQVLYHHSSYDEDVIFKHSVWNEGYQGISNSNEPIIAKYNNGVIAFDEDDLFEVSISLGYFILRDSNTFTKVGGGEEEDDAADWEVCGTADLMDGWILTCYGMDQTQNIIEGITVEKNIKEEGVYRLVNPYRNSMYADVNTSTVENGYIKFSIADPEFPYVYNGVKAGFANSNGEFYCFDLNAFYLLIKGYSKSVILSNITDGSLSTYDPSTGVLTIPTAIFGITSAPNGGYSWQDEAGNSIDMTSSIKLNFVELEDPIVTVEDVLDFSTRDLAMSNSSNTDGDITETTTYTSDSELFTVTVTPSEKTTPNRIWNNSNKPQLRVYGGYIIIEVAEGKAIKQAEINGGSGNWNKDYYTINGMTKDQFTALGNEASASKLTWKSNTTNMVIAYTASSSHLRIDNIKITMMDANDETTTYTMTLPAVEAEYTITPVVNEAQTEMTAVKFTGLDELTAGTGVITVAKNGVTVAKNGVTVAEFDADAVVIENGEATLTLNNTIVGPAEVTITVPEGAFMKGQAPVAEKTATVTLNEVVEPTPAITDANGDAVVDGKAYLLKVGGKFILDVDRRDAGEGYRSLGVSTAESADAVATAAVLANGGSDLTPSDADSYLWYVETLENGEIVIKSGLDYYIVRLMNNQNAYGGGNVRANESDKANATPFIVEAMEGENTYSLKFNHATHTSEGYLGVGSPYAGISSTPVACQFVPVDEAEPETPVELVYEANGVVGDGQGVNTNMPFFNTAVKVEAYDNNTIVVKAWDGVEGSDLKIAYAGIAQGDEVFQAIIGIEQTVDGEVVSEVTIDDDDEEMSYVTLMPQSETYPLAAIYIYNEMTGIRVEDDEDGTHMGQLSLYGAWYVAGEEGEGVDLGFGMGEPTELHYMVTWPAEPVVIVEHQFDADKLYNLGTARGYMPASEEATNLWGANYIVSVEDVAEAGKFQLRGAAGNITIFNTDIQKYLSANGTPQSVYVDEADGTFTITPATEVGGNEGAWIIKSNVTGKWMMFGGSKQFLNNDGWSAADDGDQWFITEVATVAGPADLNCDYTLNESKTVATVTVEGLTGTGVVAYYFGDDLEEPAGTLGDGENSFDVARPNLEEACSVKVTVREYAADDENMTVVADGVILIEFPEMEIVDEPLYTVENANTQQTYPAEWEMEANSTFPVVKNVKFDVYADYIYVYAWAGVEGYDLKLYYSEQEDEDGTWTAITKVVNVINGAEYGDAITTLGYIYTGREDVESAYVYVYNEEYDWYYSQAELTYANGYILLDTYYQNGYFLAWGEYDGVSSIDANTQNGTIFNLNGQKLSRLQRGINIINNHKVVVK